MKQNGRALLFSALAGAAIGVACLLRNAPALGFFGLPFLLVALEPAPGIYARPRRGLLFGWVAGTFASAASLYWVVGLLQAFAHFSLPVAVATATLLFVAQGLVLGIAAWIAAVLMARRPPGWIILPAACVVALSWTPALFPWRLATTVVDWTALVQMADLGGEPLVDLCVGLIGCGMLAAVRTHRARPALVAGVVMAAALGYGWIRLGQIRAERESAREVRVGVVQPNVSIVDKRDPAQWAPRLEQLHRMTAQVAAKRVDLVVWPESAYPYRLRRNRTDDPDGERSLRGPNPGVAILAGVITEAGEARWNSAVAMTADGRVTGIADKVELLAFGEFVPLWHHFAFLQRRFRSPGLTPGRGPVGVELAGVRWLVLNCYEDVLAGYTRGAVAAVQPEVILNITNDAWFGDTAEPYLHEHTARLRAIETRRDLVRAVNTGTSSHILATGEEAFTTQTWVETTAVARARRLHGTTVWVAVGDVWTPLAFAFLLAAAFSQLRRDRTRR